VALDARTGRLLWETQVADTMLGYAITSPPLARAWPTCRLTCVAPVGLLRIEALNSDPVPV